MNRIILFSDRDGNVLGFDKDKMLNVWNSRDEIIDEEDTIEFLSRKIVRKSLLDEYGIRIKKLPKRSERDNIVYKMWSVQNG